MTDANATKTSTRTEAAIVAAVLRKELRAAFPGIKFSVTSQNFSMGDSVRASWVDGPTVEAVDEIAGKYVSGHFDGMTDSYVYNRDRQGSTVMFMHTERELSRDLRARIATDLAAIYAGSDRDSEDMVYRALRKTDLRRPYVGVGFVDGDLVIKVDEPEVAAA